MWIWVEHSAHFVENNKIYIVFCRSAWQHRQMILLPAMKENKREWILFVIIYILIIY